MLSFASDFWPLFWTITGTAALLTVLVSLLVAVFSPEWFRSRRHQPAGTAVRLADRQAELAHPADAREAKAA